MYFYNDTISNQLSLDSTFQFGCQQCGNCCRDRGDIIVSGPDLFRIAKKAKLTMAETAERFCIPKIGENSEVPFFLLETKSYSNVCVFLKNGQCSIHDVKPAVCAVFPLGRGYNILTDEVFYFLMPENSRCGKSQTITVRKWISSFGVPERDEDFVAWSRITVYLATYIGKQKREGRKLSQEALTHIMSTLYFDYETMEGEYRPQLLKNANQLWSKLEIHPTAEIK